MNTKLIKLLILSARQELTFVRESALDRKAHVLARSPLLSTVIHSLDHRMWLTRVRNRARGLYAVGAAFPQKRPPAAVSAAPPPCWLAPMMPAARVTPAMVRRKTDARGKRVVRHVTPSTRRWRRRLLRQRPRPLLSPRPGFFRHRHSLWRARARRRTSSAQNASLCVPWLVSLLDVARGLIVARDLDLATKIRSRSARDIGVSSGRPETAGTSRAAQRRAISLRPSLAGAAARGRTARRRCGRGR